MSGKESFSYDPRSTSGTSRVQPPHEKLDDSERFSKSGSLSYLSSDKCVYDSRHSDSGIWSGSNIHSEEIQSFDCPDSPKTSGNTDMPGLDKVSDEKNPSYMRLDSGIDVSQHLSELSLKDCNSCNDLSDKTPKGNARVLTSSGKPTSDLQSSKSYSAEDLLVLQNEDGDSDLHLSIAYQFIETVFALVRLNPHQEYLDIKNNDRQTALHLAVLTKQPRLVRLLVCAGAALDELDRGGNTALHLAVQSGILALVQAIISPVTVAEINHAQLQYTPYFSSRLIPNIYNYEGQTCLHLAAISGNLDIFQHLLMAGADINAKEWKGGYTCLHIAVERRDLELCIYLLKQRLLNPEEISYAGHTAYQTACKGWDFSIAEILSKHGVDTYESDSESEEDEDDKLETDYSALPMKGGGLVDVGA